MNRRKIWSWDKAIVEYANQGHTIMIKFNVLHMYIHIHVMLTHIALPSKS